MKGSFVLLKPFPEAGRVRHFFFPSKESFDEIHSGKSYGLNA
jgi:hypothetical protein